MPALQTRQSRGGASPVDFGFQGFRLQAAQVFVSWRACGFTAARTAEARVLLSPGMGCEEMMAPTCPKALHLHRLKLLSALAEGFGGLGSDQGVDLKLQAVSESVHIANLGRWHVQKGCTAPAEECTRNRISQARAVTPLALRASLAYTTSVKKRPHDPVKTCILLCSLKANLAMSLARKSESLKKKTDTLKLSRPWNRNKSNILINPL